MASVLELILRTKKQGTAAKDTEKELSGLEKAAKSAAVAFVALGAAKVIKNATMLAARVETLGIVTKTLGRSAGLSEQEVRSLERAIVDQGITLQGSRQAIAMMIQSNVDLANATDLARLAQDTAVIANLNSSEAFQQLTYVLQTGNVRMARTLGLNVQFGQAQKELATTLGKTTAELTEQEIMQARTNAVMKAGERIAGTYEAAMGTAGKKMLSMDRQLEELSRMLGEGFLPALESVVGVLYESASALTSTTSAQKFYNEAAEDGIITDEMAAEARRDLNRATWDGRDATEVAKQQARDLDAEYKKFYATLTLMPDEVYKLSHEFRMLYPPELVVTATTEPAETTLETFGEWLSRWSRENRRKVQLQAVIRVSEELATATTEEGRIGGVFRQGGGDVQAGKPYVVGEREAELFVPGQSGHIYNQQQLAGGDININTGIAQRAFNNMAEDWMRGLGG